MIALKAGFDTQTTDGSRRTELGATMPMGAVTISAGYGKKSYDASKNYADSVGTQFGVSYALSKRTSLNAVFGSFDNTRLVSADATPVTSFADKSSSRVNLVHSF